MNRIDRLQAILIHLQSKKVVTASELADRFDLSIRTIYRDIRALEEAGVPIGSEAGIGYFLADNYHLPPISFTNNEATALLIGAKFVEQMSDSQTRFSCQSALYKIKSVLNSKEKDELEVLQNTIVVFGQNPTNNCRENALLADIQQALISNTQLNIEYHTFYSNQVNHREVEPIGIVYYANAWHLIAFCTLRKDYRDFRIDRIQKIENTNNRFVPSKHLNLEEYFEKMQQNNDAHHITLLVNENTLSYIHNVKYWYGFTFDEPACKGWRRLHFRNGDLHYFARWILMSGGEAVVEQPAELTRIVENLVYALQAAYPTKNS